MPHAAIILVSLVSTLYCNAQALLQGARVGVRKQTGFIIAQNVPNEFKGMTYAAIILVSPVCTLYCSAHIFKVE